MNNKTLLLTLSFTLGTLFTNAQSLSGFQWGEGMGTPDLSWTAQVGKPILREKYSKQPITD